MKNLSLLTLILAFGFGMKANAQTSAGSVLIGGRLSINGSNSTHQNGGSTTKHPGSSSFAILPTVGYFIKDNLALGLSTGVMNSKTTHWQGNGNEVTSTSPRFVFAPFARKYFMFSEMFGLYGEAGFSIISGSNNLSVYSPINNTTVVTSTGARGFELGARPGIVFFPSNKFGIEASFGFLGYSSTSSISKNNDQRHVTKNNSYGLNFNTATNLQFGFSYYLSR
jgi:hypothetical protein